MPKPKSVVCGVINSKGVVCGVINSKGVGGGACNSNCFEALINAFTHEPRTAFKKT